jgi:hypothetical protein
MKLHFSIGTLVLLLASTLLILTGTDQASAMINNIPIQGKLTDVAGNSLNGTYSFKFTIYDSATVGTALCTNTKDVPVTNGLFNTTMSNCSSHEFGGRTQLYLGIQVGSDAEMTPRQPLYGVPFAYGLVDGILSSGASTYHFIPGSALIKEQTGDSTTWDLVYGGALIKRGIDAGNKTVRYPITIPSVLYGQAVRVTAVTVYYKCQNGAANYIAGTYLTKNTDADSANYLINDTTHRTSNVAVNYTLNTDSAYNTLGPTQGILTLQLTLAFTDNTNYIEVTGIRLTLDTNF